MINSQDGSIGSKPLSRFRRLRNWMDASSSKRRLKRELARSEIEIRSLVEKDTGREPDSEWARNSLNFLKQVEANSNIGDIDNAWHALKAARRWELYGLYYQNKTIFDALALSIYREGTAKKIDSNWRRNVIIDLLTKDGKEFSPIGNAKDIGKVFWAQQVLDDYQDSAYEKMYILKKRLAFLNLAALLAIAGWVWLAPVLKELVVIAGGMNYRILWLAVVLSGVIGAIFSGFVRSFGDEAGKSRIPSQIAESYISYARLFVGAISAIAITVFLFSGLINFGGIFNLGLVLAIAFISGFTEKLLQSAVDKSVSTPQKSEKASGEQVENPK